MTQISNVTTASTAGARNTINDFDAESFLNLMIAELQNQDPLNPMENDELMAQIGQIREIEASDRLTQTLEAVLLGQNISSATNLIGADVRALNATGDWVEGNVSVVSIVNGQPELTLAVNPSATVAEQTGNVEGGNYIYEVVWQSTDGELYGMEIGASTSGAANFSGAVQLNDLPQTTGVKTVYRTDSSGAGDRKAVGTLAANATTFVDTLADSERLGDPITAEVLAVQYAAEEVVMLNNVAEIRPPNDTSLTRNPSSSGDESEAGEQIEANEETE